MPNPSFYIIGAPKCGTDTIANWLRGHPEVFLPDRLPENLHARDLAGWDEGHEQCGSPPGDAEGKVFGGIFPWYLFSRVAVENVLSEAPDARFVVCVRNPIDMAWALHAAAVAEGREHVQDFSVAWEMSQLRRQGRGTQGGHDPKVLDYAGACALGSQILRLATIVDSDQIHLVFLDDLASDPQSAWIDLQLFLELDVQEVEGLALEDGLFPHAEQKNCSLLRGLCNRGKAVLRPRMPRLGVSESVNGWDRRTGALRDMPKHLRHKISDYLSEDIGVLSAITGRDLSDWIS